jgi:DNA (cytosine-5)-methyltransferase 1
MQAHHTTDSESLLLRTQVADETGGALLSTPTTQDSSGKCRDHGGDLLHDVQCGCSRSERRLPTPTTRDHKDGTIAPAKHRPNDKDTLVRAIAHNKIQNNKMLPTLRASDGYERRNRKTMEKKVAEGGDVSMVTLAAVTTNWGQYAPAIERWEKVIGRPAPSPTKPDGRDGSHRLSSAFTEWMMGLPEGWVTGCGLTRNEELKACGNGVVFQQAALALKMLLDNVPLERERERERTVMLPTPTVSDTFTDNLKSSQQKPGSMHSVTLPQAVRMVSES